MSPNFGKGLARSHKVRRTFVLTRKMPLTIVFTDTRVLPPAVFIRTCGFTFRIMKNKRSFFLVQMRVF